MQDNTQENHVSLNQGMPAGRGEDGQQPAGQETPRASPRSPEAEKGSELGKQVEALEAELRATRQELEKIKEHSRQLASEKMNIALLKEVSEYKRVMELERLGKQVLEKNTLPGSTLESTVAFYLKGIEKLHKGMFCSCMWLEGDRLLMVAAPSLPENLCHKPNGLKIGENMGSCGTAAFLGQKVIASDIATDPRWQDHFGLYLTYGIKACWSLPLMGANRKVLGTIAIYHQEVKAPTPAEEQTMESIRNLLQLIMENKRAEKELRESNDRFYYATMATHDAIWDLNLVNTKINWGVGFEKLFGYKVKEFGPELDYWAQQVHPDDLDRVNASLDAVIHNEGQDFWREEYRFRKANGEYAFVVDQGTVLRDAEGKAVRIIGAIQDVTEQKITEQELRRLSMVTQEMVNGIIIMKPDLSIQWINPAFTQTFGYTLEEIAGKQPGSFLPGPGTDPDSVDLLNDKAMRSEPVECDIVLYSKAGNKLWIRMLVQPQFDAQGQLESVFALSTDITQQKAEEQTLRLLESVITNAKDAVIISEVAPDQPQKLKIIFVNEAFYRMTGYAVEEALGREPVFLNGPDTNEDTLQELLQCMSEGKPSEAELESYRKDGTKFWTHMLLIPMFNRRRQLTHWISMLRDITTRKLYEQEREVLISELTQNNADLKQFTFITSHNLRAPLANLTGIANLIDTDSIPEGRNKVLIQKFKESTVQLNAIIDDLLEVLVIKNNPHTNKEEVDLAQAFEMVIVSVDGLLTDTDFRLTTDFSQVPRVYYNAGYLHSILLNLLTNAIKYRSPDRPLRIDIRTQRVNGCDKLYFSDNGLGIDLKRFGERIFGLYQRFHQHKDSKGMGLYIAHSQAKAMGGNLSVTSEVDKGTTFILEF